MQDSQDYDDSVSDSDSSFDNHRHKRAKTSLTLGHRDTVESRRSKLVNSGRGLARRVSSACQRAVTPGRQQSISRRPALFISRGATPAPEPTPSPGTPSFTLIDRPKMRFVFVGDAECGKSSILLYGTFDVWLLTTSASLTRLMYT